MHALPNKCDQSKKIQCIHPVLPVSKAGGKHDVGKSISVIKALVNHTETISAPKKVYHTYYLFWLPNLHHVSKLKLHISIKKSEHGDETQLHRTNKVTF